MMDKQPTPVETPEELELRRSMSETLYERDMTFSKALQEQRQRENRSWEGGF